MYKVGDRVRVTTAYPSDKAAGFKKGFTFEVVIVYPTNSVEVRCENDSTHYLNYTQIEKVEEDGYV